MSQLSMIKFKNKKFDRFWFNWNFDFCDLIIANRSNSRLIIEPRIQEIIGRAGFIEKFDNNENIEMRFEIILSKNVMHWNFDNEHSEKIKRCGFVKISSVDKSNEYKCNQFESKNKNKLWTGQLKICLAYLS